MSRFPALFFTAFFLLSCSTVPLEMPLPAEIPAPAAAPAAIDRPPGAGGIAEEIRFSTETGSPSSLLNALDIIREKDLGQTEFGRVMTAVNVTLLNTLYPAVRAQLPAPDPPVTHSYSRILSEAKRGVYTAPRRNSPDYLEHVLPFLAYYSGVFSPEQYFSALPHLKRALELNGESVLAPYFLGILYENTDLWEDAYTQYSLAWERYPDCYPAALGLARIMEAQGRAQESVRFLSDIALRFPGNLQVKRELAIAYYRSGDMSRAETAAAEILQQNSQDGEFILMSAHILAEQGNLLEAQTFLDQYAGINPTNKLYLFLRARIQAEANLNKDAALNYLRSILKTSPDNEEAALYATRLLMESTRPLDQAEGRKLLAGLLSVSAPSLEAVSLALNDAIRREEWQEARIYLGRLLEERRSSGDLLAAYTVEREQ